MSLPISFPSLLMHETLSVGPTTLKFHCVHAPTRKLKAAFQQRGLSASDMDVRAWIERRDTSGTGAVDFADFSRAFV